MVVIIVDGRDENGGAGERIARIWASMRIKGQKEKR